MARNILWFKEIGMDDVKNVGGKCASLGEMTRNIENLGIRVPYGFAISTDAYDFSNTTSELVKLFTPFAKIKFDNGYNIYDEGKEPLQPILTKTLGEFVFNQYDYNNSNRETSIKRILAPFLINSCERSK